MRAMMRFLLAALMLLPVAAGAQDAQEMVRAYELSGGQERILSFVSAVTIARNGDLDVTETIDIVSLAQEIRHGIQRDFPTSYRNGLGQRTRVGFSVVSVQRDGHDEPWQQMGLSNGIRIRIGDGDEMLPPGEHVYTIRYRTTRQIRYGTDYDEIYWNVTGNGWTFPIDKAEARITLPVAAKFGNRAVYTGYQGATERNVEVVEERPGYIAFRTTKPLEREQGLTVAAAFPKGVLDAPGAGRELGWWLEDWGALGAGFASLLAFIAYYIRAWAKAGRGPRAGPVVPIFSPPDDLTPAAVRYIANMKFDNRAFSAAIVDLGVRRHLRIEQEEGGWFSKGTTTLTRTDPPDGASPLFPPEREMKGRLFGVGSSIELKQVNHSTLQAAQRALESGLKSAYAGKLFRDNKMWAVFGILAIPLAMVAIGTFAILVGSPGDPLVALKLPLFLALAVGTAWWLWTRLADAKGGMAILAWLSIGVTVAAAGAISFMIIGTALGSGAWSVLIPLLALPLALSAFKWMYAPTVEGRAVMDRIAGFKQYLGITEESRLEALHPPDKTPELFERYLPYAIALDVENRWAARFVDVLAAAAVAGTATHAASWYSGDDSFWNDPGGFADNLGSSFASTVSSASTSPSSSSGGSSGGGSSGGGGGGGGGSGW